MALLKPRSPWLDWWEYRLTTGTGRSDHEIILYEDMSAEIVIDYAGMALPTQRYHLFGNHKRLSDGYGWIEIDKAEVDVTDARPAHSINITDFEGGILLEYYRVVQSPHLPHPHDMLMMMRPMGYATWNENFDVLVVVAPFTQGLIEGLRHTHLNPSEHYPPPDIDAIEDIAGALARIDKCKLRRRDNSD